MKIEHLFVEFIPEALAANTLYISMRYRTTSHLCMCGCGSKIVLPIRPERWQLYFDGDSISMTPSVGNWELPCQSHYWITNGCVEWSYKMSDNEIKHVKSDQKKRIDNYYTSRPTQPSFVARLAMQLKKIIK